MIRNFVTLATATIAALFCATAFCSAQSISADESLHCNSPENCQQLFRYYSQKSNSSDQPVQAQYAVLAIRSYLVFEMYECQQMKDSEQISSMSSAWEQLLIHAESSIALVPHSLALLVAASHNDPTTIRLASQTEPFVTQAAAICRPNLSPFSH